MNWLANVVLVLHALLVLFIVGGLVAIWVGEGLKLGWVRNRVLRIVHLAAIGIVALLAVLDIPCPLTVLEDWLRTGSVNQEGFIQHWVSALLYYTFPDWVFATAYVLFLLVVAITWWRIPPRT